MEQYLKENWIAGWAMDLHTISCSKNSDGSFNTIKSEICELVYQLKYQQNISTINELSNKVESFMKSGRVFSYVDVILPVTIFKTKKFTTCS